MIDFVIISLTSLANILLGLVIFIRDPKSVINRLFGLIILGTVLWITTNYLADYASIGNLLFTRLTFTSVALFGIAWFLFSDVFPDRKHAIALPIRILEGCLGVLIAILTFTPYIVADVTKTASGVDLIFGPLYLVFILYVVQLAALVAVSFLYHLRKAKSGKEKTQISLVLIGFSAYFFLGLILSLVWPLLSGNWASSRYSPVSTIVVIALTAYAIIKHQLFDVRLAVARSVAYIFSLGVLLIMFTGVTRLILEVDYLAGDSSLQEIIRLLLIGVIILSFQPLKQLFDRITNRIFYRDAYDPQELLDELNTVLVGNVELHKVITGTSETITNNLKSEFVDISLRDKDGTLISSNSIKFTQADGHSLRSALESRGSKMVNTEALEVGSKLRKLLKKYNIALAYPLLTNVDGVIIGYLFLGGRRSGNLYTEADQRLLYSVSDELSIAVQNALYLREIKKFSQTLEHKVEEQTKDLRAKNEKLKRLDEAKDEFISMASHQLRTPLTSVKGYISMVLDGDAGKLTDEQRKILEQAFGSSQRMVYLIGDFLNVSRIQTGKFEIERAPVDLASVVSQEISQLVETAKTKRITMTYEVPENFPTINADENKLRQVMMNFMDNAIYYSPADTKIKVQLYKEAGSVVFKVTDQGIGVPKADQPKLFTKFFRAPNAKQQRPDGTGIGLYMAKKVIVGHHGTVIFETKEGKGSTFGFKLPIKETK